MAFPQGAHGEGLSQISTKCQDPNLVGSGQRQAPGGSQVKLGQTRPSVTTWTGQTPTSLNCVALSATLPFAPTLESHGHLQASEALGLQPTGQGGCLLVKHV